MNNIETISNSRPHGMCSVKEREEKHAQRIAARAGLVPGEPIPQLSEAQIEQYDNVLRNRLGIPEQDASRLVATVKENYEHANEVEKIRLARVVSQAIEAVRPAPRMQEVPVFERTRHS